MTATTTVPSPRVQPRSTGAGTSIRPARSPAPSRAIPQQRRSGATVREPGGTPLRLTRRGRLVITLSLLVLMVAGAVLFSSRSMASDERGAPEATHTVVVERGDTLWQIAATVAGPGEVREMVHRIEKLNAMPGPALVEGQELAVPLG